MTWDIDAALEKHADMVRRICFLHLTRREGYAVTEIGRVLGKNTNTVYSYLHRARSRMRRQLGGFEDEDEHEKSL